MPVQTQNKICNALSELPLYRAIRRRVLHQATVAQIAVRYQLDPIQPDTFPEFRIRQPAEFVFTLLVNRIRLGEAGFRNPRMASELKGARWQVVERAPPGVIQFI